MIIKSSGNNIKKCLSFKNTKCEDRIDSNKCKGLVASKPNAVFEGIYNKNGDGILCETNFMRINCKKTCSDIKDNGKTLYNTLKKQYPYHSSNTKPMGFHNILCEKTDTKLSKKLHQSTADNGTKNIEHDLYEIKREIRLGKNNGINFEIVFRQWELILQNSRIFLGSIYFFLLMSNI